MVSNIAIAGISSKLALFTTQELLKQPGVNLRGSCRGISKLPQWLRDSSRVSLIETGPYDTDTLRTIVKGSDVVMCCYLADNDTMTRGQKLLIDLCSEEGVPRYIASDYTADYTKLNYGHVVITDPMKQVKGYVDSKSVKGVHILIGLLMETYWDIFAPWKPEEKVFEFWGTGNEKWESTSYRTAAEYVAAVAIDPDAVGMFKFMAEYKSTSEIADDFNAVYGFRPTLQSLGSLDDLRKRMGSGERQDGLAAGQYHMLSGHWPVHDKLDNGLYPSVKTETLRDFFKKYNVLERQMVFYGREDLYVAGVPE